MNQLILGIQRYNGAFGGLIIRRPLSLEATSKYYDMDEHVIILADWSHNAPELFHVGLPTRKPGPEAVLINGKGKFLDVSRENRFITAPRSRTLLNVPAALKFELVPSLKYRTGKNKCANVPKKKETEISSRFGKYA